MTTIKYNLGGKSRGIGLPARGIMSFNSKPEIRRNIYRYAISSIVTEDKSSGIPALTEEHLTETHLTETHLTKAHLTKAHLTKAQKKCLQRVSELERLEFNWDGYKGKKISKKAITGLCKLIELIDYMPEIFPCHDGSIQIEYDGKNDSYLEICLFNNQVEIFGIEENGQEKEEKIPLDSNGYGIRILTKLAKEIIKFNELHVC